MKIILENITKRFPGRGKKATEVVAVNNFDFEFSEGKLIGLFEKPHDGKGKHRTGNAVSHCHNVAEKKRNKNNSDK